jgi:hypothetical protein
MISEEITAGNINLMIMEDNFPDFGNGKWDIHNVPTIK